MPETNPPSSATIARGYEARDIWRNSLPVAISAAVVCGVIIFFLTHWIYRFTMSRPRNVDTPNSIVSEQSVPSGRTLPPVGREDVRPLREQENKVFNQLGWKAEGSEVPVKIPDAVIDALKAREKR